MNQNVLKMRSPRTGRCVALAACAGILAATACSGSGPTSVACTAQFVYGLAITVQNAATGAQITDSASVVVTDGSYKESYTLGATGQPGGVISAAGERAGTYSISIRKAQFAPYDTAGVTVTKDACHVQTVQVVAKLQPLAAS